MYIILCEWIELCSEQTNAHLCVFFLCVCVVLSILFDVSSRSRRSDIHSP